MDIDAVRATVHSGSTGAGSGAGDATPPSAGGRLPDLAFLALVRASLEELAPV